MAGSSPRLRGTVVLAGLLETRLSAHPTGSSPRLRGTVYLGRVFDRKQVGEYGSSPRLRGTGQGVGRRRSGAFGSSPRLRGTDPIWPHPSGQHRFIPAPANREQLRIVLHPRACGEQLPAAQP